MPPEQARAIGLDRQVLGEMVLQAGLDQRARQMRLGVSECRDFPAHHHAIRQFQTPNGQFDRARFEHVLRNAGYTEQRFVAEQRELMLRRQIIESVSGDRSGAESLARAINQFQNEQRSVEYLALGPAQAGDIPQPTDDELSKYFRTARSVPRAGIPQDRGRRR